ncbi:MAG: NUDIX domain-containing protein [Candidatus Marinimicrobia bacterium]|jgi:dATP pyrophosphohydrolase|nr:NUDIX domain-containing protein [Candidatus Neomarinimicrobiota bacterium]
MTKIVTRVIDCWVINRSFSELKFLIMKRNKGLQYEGIYHCVHGKIDENESAWAAALRELKEETGLIPDSFFVTDFTSNFYEAEPDRFNLVPVFVADVKSVSVKLSKEHSEYNWLTFEEAMQQVAWENHKKAIDIINKMFTTGFPQKKWLKIKI